MSEILSLPLVTVSIKVATADDLLFGIVFTQDGAPLDLTGISFTLRIPTIGSLPSGLGDLFAYQGMVVFSVKAAVKAAWPTGIYQLILTASDGVLAQPVLFESRLGVGLGGASTLTTISAPGATAALATSSQLSGGGSGGSGGGGGSSFGAPKEFTGIAAGQTIVLDRTPGGAMLLFVEGLIQSPSNFSVSGTNLVLPPGLVWDGAPCLFVY
jgi:hypothetical protein